MATPSASSALVESNASSSTYQTAAETSDSLTSPERMDLSHLTNRELLMGIYKETRGVRKELRVESKSRISEATMGIKIDV